MSSTTRLVLLSTLSTVLITVTAELSGCFEIQRGKRLDCVTPTVRRSPVTEAECRQLCLTQPADCIAANYNFYKHICELFDVPISENQFPNRRLVRSTRCYTGAVIVRTIGTTYLEPKAECLLPKDKSNLRRQDPVKPVITVSIPSDATGKAGKNSFNDVVMVPIVPDCPIGERARVQIIDGVMVATEPTVSFNVDMPDKCIEACRMNTYPSGSRLPLLCRSATFDRRNSKCAVFPDALNPNGYLDYRPDNVVLYMEKLCLSDVVLPLSCDDMFRRVPQHILLGHAAEIVTASSQTECVKECVMAKLRRLDCHSVLHYMDVPYQNCILNIHSRHSRPQYFLPELRMKVDYIEVPACALSLISEQNDAIPIHEPSPPVATPPVMDPAIENKYPITNENGYPTPEDKVKNMLEGKASVEFDWSEWSPCDPLNGIRKRERVCSNCKETSQTEPCFPNEKNEFNEALQKFVEDQEKLEKLEEEKLATMDKPMKDADERAGFVRKLPPSKLIPFPVQEEEPTSPTVSLKTEMKTNSVEFFGPPLKPEDAHRRIFNY